MADILQLERCPILPFFTLLFKPINLHRHIPICLTNINDELPGSKWDLNFNERNGTTSVSITIKLKTLAHPEYYTQKGFKEGFAMTLNDLEKLLKNLK